MKMLLNRRSMLRLEESQRTWTFEGLSVEHFRPGTNEVGVGVVQSKCAVFIGSQGLL